MAIVIGIDDTQHKKKKKKRIILYVYNRHCILYIWFVSRSSRDDLEIAFHQWQRTPQPAERTTIYFFIYLILILIFPFHFSHPKHAPWYPHFDLSLVSLSPWTVLYHLCWQSQRWWKRSSPNRRMELKEDKGATYIIVSDMGMQTTNRRHQQHLYSTWGDGAVTS